MIFFSRQHKGYFLSLTEPRKSPREVSISSMQELTELKYYSCPSDLDACDHTVPLQSCLSCEQSSTLSGRSVLQRKHDLLGTIHFSLTKALFFSPQSFSSSWDPSYVPTWPLSLGFFMGLKGVSLYTCVSIPKHLCALELRAVLICSSV